jgi:hypothetical protein
MGVVSIFWCLRIFCANRNASLILQQLQHRKKNDFLYILQQRLRQKCFEREWCGWGSRRQYAAWPTSMIGREGPSIIGYFLVNWSSNSSIFKKHQTKMKTCTSPRKKTSWRTCQREMQNLAFSATDIVWVENKYAYWCAKYQGWAEFWWWRSL